ncbi:hypothetical protein [Streptomyces chartreusis]|uniref:hypothetical protein n=1 Tax=Streptomyces chartreusis TaxID=1969 RepID=UPI0033AEA00E
MLQFGESTVRLAEVARQSGHAAEAVSELWPLVARREARVEDGHTERDALHLLARARVGLGVALGNVLPEERPDKRLLRSRLIRRDQRRRDAGIRAGRRSGRLGKQMPTTGF